MFCELRKKRTQNNQTLIPLQNQAIVFAGLSFAVRTSFHVKLYFSGMKLLSLNVGVPQNVLYREKSLYTSIYKSPVEGSRRVFNNNIEGDQQSDLKVHGGKLKAVYAYDVLCFSIEYVPNSL